MLKSPNLVVEMAVVTEEVVLAVEIAQVVEAAHEEEHMVVTVTEVAMIVVLEVDSKVDLAMVATAEVASKADPKETAIAELAVVDLKDVHLKEELNVEPKEEAMVDSKGNLKVVLEKREDLVLVVKVAQVLEEEEIKNSLA